MITQEKLLENLNPQQELAVRHRDGPILILAGAGSGKTRVITRRIAYLVSQGVRPWNILAITFTNRAANEMKARVHHLCPAQADDVAISTFHSFCARFLRREASAIGLNPHFTIYDEKDQRNLIKRCLDALAIDEKKYRPGLVAELINRAKDDLLDAGSFSIHAATSGDPYRRLISEVYERYDRELMQAGSLDFGDLIMKTVEALRDKPAVRETYQQRFHYVMIDEYQDTNRAQYLLVKYLAGAHKNLMVVGDDDQAIYRWRGADVRNILEFEKDFTQAKVIKLEQNYRSTCIILDAAWRVIKNNNMRKEKKLWTSREGGEPVHVCECVTEQDEAQFVTGEIERLCSEGPCALRDFAVFYRTNAQSRVMEDFLRKRNLPYKIFGSARFYDRQEIKDMLAYLKCIVNPADSISCRRIINVPGRGIGKVTQEILDGFAAKNSIPLFEALRRLDEITGLNPRTKNILVQFRDLIEHFIARSDGISASELVKNIYDRTGYIAALENEDTPEADSRLGNLKELITAIVEFEESFPGAKAASFVEQVSLISDIDKLDGESSYVTLMTLHLAKGLEFSHVFITGLEEGLFPMGESSFDPNELEEERRLAYVGMTRAKNKLYLSYASSRKLYGQKRWNIPSRFITEAGFAVQEDGYQAGATDGAADASADDPYVVGRRVRHTAFGSGEIIQISGSGEALKVTVQFDSGVWKKLLVKYAPLEKL